MLKAQCKNEHISEKGEGQRERRLYRQNSRPGAKGFYQGGLKEVEDPTHPREMRCTCFVFPCSKRIVEGRIEKE